MQKIVGVLQFLILIFVSIFTFNFSYADTPEQKIATLNEAIATYSLAIEIAEKNGDPQVKINSEYQKLDAAKVNLGAMENYAAFLRQQISQNDAPTNGEIDALIAEVKQLQSDLIDHINKSTDMQQQLEIEGHHFLATPRPQLSTEEFDSVLAVELNQKNLAHNIDIVFHRIITLKKAALGHDDQLRLIETAQHLYNVVLIQSWLPHFQKYANSAAIQNLGYDGLPTAGGQAFTSLMRMLRGKDATKYYVPSIIDDSKIRERFFLEFDYNDNVDNYDAKTRIREVLKNYNILAKQKNVNQENTVLVTYENNYQPAIKDGNDEALFYIQLINNQPFQGASNPSVMTKPSSISKPTSFDAILTRKVAGIEGVVESQPGVYRIPKTLSCELLFKL